MSDAVNLADAPASPVPGEDAALVAIGCDVLDAHRAVRAVALQGEAIDQANRVGVQRTQIGSPADRPPSMSIVAASLYRNGKQIGPVSLDQSVRCATDRLLRGAADQIRMNRSVVGIVPVVAGRVVVMTHSSRGFVSIILAFVGRVPRAIEG